MRPADRNASARSKPLRRPAEQYLPRPPAGEEFLRQPQKRDADDARPTPQRPPCPPPERAGPVRGHRPLRLHSRHVPVVPPERIPERTLVLGRAPWPFGYEFLSHFPSQIQCHATAVWLF